MRPPLRIAVLECDVPIGNTRAKYGNYGGLFEALLRQGATRLGQLNSGKEPELDITKYDVVNHEIYPSLEDIDAVLLTGSRFDAFENDTWILKLVEYMKTVLMQRRVRIIGVCFGHQIVGRALGVKVGRGDKGWEVAVVDIPLTGKGKELFGKDVLSIHQMHRDIVYALPPGIEGLGSTDRCEVQGMYQKDRLISVQGHPEFNGDIEEEIIHARYDKGVFNEAMRDDALDRVRNHHDGVLIAATFLQFLLDN